jgi:hypothetical protein
MAHIHQQAAAVLLGGVVATSIMFAAGAGASTQAAKNAFDEARAVCERDAGALWKRSLCGPLLVVDPASRSVWANQADAEGVLKAEEGVFVGALPDGVPVANTAVEWSGTRWSMVTLPLPKDPVARRVLLTHESWHRIQEELGLPARDAICNHLATERGRLLLRLEMRALARALRADGEARWAAARDALLFRRQRHEEFDTAAAAERELDRHEALAEYTGVRLGAGSDAHAYAAASLDRFDGAASYVRSYAYATGPAYGLLLDERRPRWKNELTTQTPADLLAAELELPANVSAETVAQAAARYDGEAVRAEEADRAERERQRIAELTAAFTSGARVVLPLRRMQIEFNPSRITPLEGIGNVYEVITVRDEWGELRASEGALVSVDFKQVVVRGPASDGLSGPGWTLTLRAPFKLVEHEGALTAQAEE